MRMIYFKSISTTCTCHLYWSNENVTTSISRSIATIVTQQLVSCNVHENMAMSGRTQKGKRYVHDHRTFCMQHNTCSYCLYPAKPSMVTNIFHAGHCIDQAHNLLPSASSLARNLGKPFAFNCALNFRSCQLIVHLHIEILIRFVPFHL